MKDSILILSGGMDSTTLLYDECHAIAVALSFDYGSNHNAQEIACAKEHCERLGVEHVVIAMDFMAKHFKSSLLAGGDAIPEGHYEDANMQSTVVPFRNGIMLAIAAGMAESRGLRRVMMFNDSGYNEIYTDCRAAFVEAMSEATRLGTYPGIEVVGPYTHLTKGDIAKRGKQLGIDYSHTWSCYKGGEHHCGKCGTCVERKEALAEAGITDTTTYCH